MLQKNAARIVLCRATLATWALLSAALASPNAGHLFDAPWSSAYDRAADEDALGRVRRHLETHLSAE